MFYSFQIELLSVGTLLAYTMVAISVLLTRYQPGVECHVYGKAAKLERTNQWLESITSEPQYPPPISDQSELEKRDTVKGLIIYILYGYRRSKEALKPKESSEGDFILYENPNVDASFKHIQPKRKSDEQQSGN